jgi:hypothetical protein
MWHPETEAEACCELTAMLEWLRATRGPADLSPEALFHWHDSDPAGFAEAFALYDPETKTAATRQARIAAVFAEYARIRRRSSNAATG